jgi:hypothetical protein
LGGIFKSRESITVKKEVVIFITPRLMKEGQIALSDSHDLLNTEQELKDLSGSNDLLNTEQELKGLLEIVSLFDVGQQNRDNLLDIEKERDFLHRKSP